MKGVIIMWLILTIVLVAIFGKDVFVIFIGGLILMFALSMVNAIKDAFKTTINKLKKIWEIIIS